MPREAGDGGTEEGQTEERETRDEGQVPEVRDDPVPDRGGVGAPSRTFSFSALFSKAINTQRRLGRTRWSSEGPRHQDHPARTEGARRHRTGRTVPRDEHEDLPDRREAGP